MVVFSGTLFWSVVVALNAVSLVSGTHYVLGVHCALAPVLVGILLAC